MKQYEIIDHTADIGLKAYGKNLQELFINSASGMFYIIASLEKLSLAESIRVELESSNIEELLVAWLRELLYQHASREMLFKDFIIERISESSIKATARGEKIDLARHEVKREIKAVTYHGLKVEKIDGNWTAQIIFDV